jgi:SAM-dependent methyltransferase
MECSLCRRGILQEVLNLGKQPLANKYPTADQFAAEEFFDLDVLFCPRCKNVQLGTVISRARMFEDYYYLSSVNAGLVRHFEALAEKLKDAKFVVDIGSNDGILLAPLKRLGVEAVGIEPSVNVSEIANNKGLFTFCAFFDAKCAALLSESYGPADVIVASSVFTHLEDPHQFIEDVKSLLAPDGRFIIEVEYIGNIIKNVQFERFYLDRIFYYSLTSLCHLFSAHHMVVTDVEHIEPHGGSLRVTVQRDGTPSENVDAIMEEENQMLTLASLRIFSIDSDIEIDNLFRLLETLKGLCLKVAGYGAPARLSTICNYGGIGPDLIKYVMDDSPLKQGRFTPGTHIPIVGPEHLTENKPDILVVFAYEYLDDIKAKTGNAFRYVLPIPPKEV